jgi:hypothetical protein
MDLKRQFHAVLFALVLAQSAISNLTAWLLVWLRVEGSLLA